MTVPAPLPARLARALADAAAAVADLEGMPVPGTGPGWAAPSPA